MKNNHPPVVVPPPTALHVRRGLGVSRERAQAVAKFNLERGNYWCSAYAQGCREVASEAVVERVAHRDADGQVAFGWTVACNTHRHLLPQT